MFGKYEKAIFILCAVIYVILGVVITNYATNVMSERELLFYANKARELAVLVSKNYRITDAEVDEIKRLEFKELLQHPANIRLEEVFGHDFSFDDIKYAYIMVMLDETQIKYFVTDEYKEFYGAEIGTPLNLLWLVDLVVNRTAEELLAEDATYYDDIKRYSYFHAESEKAYRDRIPVYSVTDYEYGRLITGRAPLYSAEGTFVGMLGVNLYVEQYEYAVKRIKAILSSVFTVPTVILTFAYIILYIRNRKHVYSKVYTDSLTSIKNRRFIEEYFPSIVKDHYKKRMPLSVIMIDVDSFKLFNDHYGHQYGDEVLKKIARTIQSVLREKSDFISRYGGEEMLVILTNTNLSTAEMVANRIITSVNALAIKHEYSVCSNIVTVSQGIYSAVPQSMNYAKNFIMRADQGLYEAKNNGRNQYIAIEE
jgi:diguanylate cyclase (GGDEF)-like protein